MSLPTDDFCQGYTTRDFLRDEIERMVIIDNATLGLNLRVEEKDKTISILPNGAKFIFTPEGEIKTIVKGGKAFSADGERKYVPPKGKS